MDDGVAKDAQLHRDSHTQLHRTTAYGQRLTYEREGEGRRGPVDTRLPQAATLLQTSPAPGPAPTTHGPARPSQHLPVKNTPALRSRSPANRLLMRSWSLPRGQEEGPSGKWRNRVSHWGPLDSRRAPSLWGGWKDPWGPAWEGEGRGGSLG